MLIYKQLENYLPTSPVSPLVLALGNFDGVHLGHQALLNQVIQDAKSRKGQSAVLTFQQHPQSVLHPEKKPLLLTSIEHKLLMLESFGIDLCFLLSFTEQFAALEPEAFVTEILVKRLQIAKICLGYNARFGKGRKGDAALLSRLAKQHHFEFQEVAGVQAAGDFVSSSRLREMIQKGNLDAAKLCLGRPYTILTEVTHGEGRGVSLGFPTANLRIHHEVLPPEGVYAVKVRLIQQNSLADGVECSPGKWQQAVLNYGRRPTFQKEATEAVAEVFILDFTGNLYEQALEVAFLKRIRDEKKFANTEDLKAQIKRDIEVARLI